MGEVKYWDGEDFTVLDSKNAKSVNGIKFRINEDILEYSNDGLTWSAQSNFSGSYNDLSDKPTIPSDTNQLSKTDVYTKTEVNDLMSSAGFGDMVKAVYDKK